MFIDFAEGDTVIYDGAKHLVRYVGDTSVVIMDIDGNVSEVSKFDCEVYI